MNFFERIIHSTLILLAIAALLMTMKLIVDMSLDLE